MPHFLKSDCTPILSSSTFYPFNFFAIIKKIHGDCKEVLFMLADLYKLATSLNEMAVFEWDLLADTLTFDA